MMQRLSNKNVTALKFEKLEKASHVSDEDFIAAAVTFEESISPVSDGLVFRCLLRNLSGHYATLTLAEDKDGLKLGDDHAKAQEQFMTMVEPETAQEYTHEILKEGFSVPEHFTCFEHGIFVTKPDSGFSEKKMLDISERLEGEYLNTFDNSLGHFMGKLDEQTYSEINFGQTLGKTRQICFGYLENEVGTELISLYIPESVNLDFWTVVA